MSDAYFVHQPGHPVGTQPGPQNSWAWFCKRPDCSWHEVSGPDRQRTAYLVTDPEDGAA